MEKGKLLIVALTLALLLGLAQSFEFDEKDLESEESLWDLYERWRSHHTHSRDPKEKHKRFNVFKMNVKFIHEFNKKDKPYKLRLNKFGDMTSHEFKSSYAGSKVKHYRMLHGDRHKTGFIYDQVENVPPSVDWRKKGAVTGVKDQGQCGESFV
ncbi:hypothetical protein IFM89_033286 [Coptis chinensis]|uniref:Cathepsin propeptide inhibitor domain-containing protein n=1 Tax=Coptis chinensis TaxID=261450 RepID=A0A835HRN4_9MAGN|nr:hypothetical protein IFM89_033286 [Coptis chinensis]